MKLFLSFVFVLCCLVLGVWRAQAMSSTNYSITWDNVNMGGDELSQSTHFQLSDSLGQTDSGPSSGGSYSVNAGYRSGTPLSTLAFAVYGQSTTTVAAYTTFATSTSKYVVVASAAGFAPGDYVAVAENQGYNARVVVGRVIGIAGDILTVDSWSDENSIQAYNPAGGDDFVYRLSESEKIRFGTLTVGAENLSLLGGSVFSSATSGYTVYVHSDGDLRNVTDTIPAVADGSVSSNADEYGVEAIGLRAISPGTDVALTTTQQPMFTRTSHELTPERFAMLYKVGVTSATPAGDYGQIVYYTITANY